MNEVKLQYVTVNKHEFESILKLEISMGVLMTVMKIAIIIIKRTRFRILLLF